MTNVALMYFIEWKLFKVVFFLKKDGHLYYYLFNSIIVYYSDIYCGGPAETEKSKTTP